MVWVGARGWSSATSDPARIARMGCGGSRPVGSLRACLRVWGRRVVLALGALGATGCRVPTPTPREVRDLDLARLGSPRAAFEQFATAFRGGLLDAEYECFSSAFRHRNGGQLMYREYRDRLLEQHPRLRWALWKARVTAVEERPDGRSAVLRATVPIPLARDLELTFWMVLEDYYEVWLGEKPVAFGVGPPEEFDLLRDGHLLQTTDGGLALWAYIPLDRPLTAEQLERISAVRLGREWRIDDFSIERPD